MVFDVQNEKHFCAVHKSIHEHIENDLNYFILDQTMDYSNTIREAREHRSTQNKVPARYVLTPTPPQSKKINSLHLLDYFTIGQARFIDHGMFFLI